MLRRFWEQMQSVGGRISRRLRLLGLILAIALGGVAASASAQAPQDGPAPDSADQAPAADPFGRSTPAGTINGFIDAIADQDYERASFYLELSAAAPARRATAGPELAQDLHRTLDRQGSILPANQISDDPAGNPADNLDPRLEEVGTIGAGGDAVALLLRRVSEAGGDHWLIAAETLRVASRMSEAGPEVAAEAWLPTPFTSRSIAGAPVSHWLTLLGATVIAFAVTWLGLRLVLFVLRRVGLGAGGLHQFLRAIQVPLALFVALLIANTVAPLLGISIVARQTFGWLSAVIGPLVLGWLLLQLIDAVNDRALSGIERWSRASATSIVRFAGRVAKAIVIAVAIMAFLDALGFDVTAVLAALGIGGLALALGAQRTVENLIASISIIFDRPCAVGDFCQIGDVVGTVEDIGMRSTRVRTLARTVVTIPNSNLLASEIQNFAPRDRFLFNPVLHVATETPSEKLRALLTSLRAVLKGDERLLGQTARVRMVAPANDRLPIELFGYILAADFDAFLETQEDLMLKLLDAVAAQGLALAPPTINLRRRVEAAQ